MTTENTVSGEFEGEHAALTKQVIGIFYKVANDLGFGFIESVYRRAMLIALTDAGLQASEEVPIQVSYRDRSAGIFYADLVVEGKVILELKVAEAITRQHRAQLLHYLRSSEIE